MSALPYQPAARRATASIATAMVWRGREQHFETSGARPSQQLAASVGQCCNSRIATLSPCCRGVPLPWEAVAQTPIELAESVLRPGSENGQVVRHTRDPLLATTPGSAALDPTSASGQRLFRDGFMRQPPTNAGAAREPIACGGRPLLVALRGSARARRHARSGAQVAAVRPRARHAFASRRRCGDGRSVAPRMALTMIPVASS